MGIDEEGRRQILGFYIGGQESANGWRDVLKDLYKRYNERYEIRVTPGFGIPEVKKRLNELFEERYPSAKMVMEWYYLVK